jgi:hypothetical protein
MLRWWERYGFRETEAPRHAAPPQAEPEPVPAGARYRE